MDDLSLLTALEVEAGRIGAVGPDGGDAAQPVPTCPGWSIGRVVGHVGLIHRWATALLAADPPTFISPSEVERPPRDASVFRWYREGVGPLLAELGRVDLGMPAHTWAGERDRRWWLRRLAHETGIHRFDVQNALSAPDPIAASAAADGIDELFEVFVPTNFDAAGFASAGHLGRTMHLHCSDIEGEWLVAFEASRLSVEHRHAKGDVAVNGRASDLFLTLWNREDSTTCRVFGDPKVLDAFLEASAF